MKKLVKISLMIVAPVLVLSACASTPKCDNDACYNNRQISSVNQATEADDQDQSARQEYFRAEGNHRD